MLKELLELFRVFFHLAVDAFNVLAGALVLTSNLVKDLSYHAQTVDLVDILDLTLQVLRGERLYLLLFFLRVAVVVDSASVRQRIVHCKLLLEIADFLLEALNLKGWVHDRVDNSLILHFSHSSGEL